MPDLFAPSEFSKKRDNYETRLQIATVQYLQGQIKNGRNSIKVQKPFDVIFFHPVNEYVDAKEAFWAKAKGISAGTPDLIFFWQNSFGAIELKSKTGYLSGPQKDFKAHFEPIGGKWGLCRKVSEVRDMLISWGIPCKNTNVIEPRLSHEELMALQVEIYRK